MRPPRAHDFPGHGLPHLSGTVLGIEELLDERSLGSLLVEAAAAAKELAEDVLQGAEDRQALDPLRSPLGTDGRTAFAPDLLRIRLEKRAIQLAAEAVDEELFQVLLRPERKEGRAKVTETDLHHPQQAEFLDRVQAQRDGIVEEPAEEIDAALPLPQKHDLVARLRVGPLPCRGHVAVLAAVADRGLPGLQLLDRHAIEPPLHHAVRLGEEAMAADVDAVALVVGSPRYAADIVLGLQHDGHDARPLEQLEGGGQARRPSPDDDRGFRHLFRFRIPAAGIDPCVHIVDDPVDRADMDALDHAHVA